MKPTSPLILHPSLYRQCELVPASNLNFCRELLRDKAERLHAGAPEDTQCAPPAMPTPLLSTGIPLPRFESALVSLLPRHETTSGTVQSARMRTVAFGRKDEFLLFCESAVSPTVSTLWLDYGATLDTDGLARFAHMFETIATFGDLMLVDWPWELAFPLGDSGALSAFVRRLRA